MYARCCLLAMLMLCNAHAPASGPDPNPLSSAFPENYGACIRRNHDLLDENGVLDLADLAPDEIWPGLSTTSDLAAVIFPQMEAAVRTERFGDAETMVVERVQKISGAPRAVSTYYKLGVVEVLSETGDFEPAEECKDLKFLLPMSPEEVEAYKREHGGMGEDIANLMEMYANALTISGAALEGVAPGGLSNAQVGEVATDIARGCPGLKKEIDKHGYSETIINQKSNTLGSGSSPMIFLAGPACMARDSALYLRNYRAEAVSEEASRQLAALNEAMEAIELGNREDVGGVEAQEVKASNLNVVHETDDGITVEMDSMSVWIDPEQFTRRKIRFEGTLESDGEPEPFFLEKEFDDFRYVPGTILYEPYREVLRMGGMLGPEEQAKLAEAQQKVNEYEAELAAMPAAKRKLMERMMGSQLDQMRSLANSGTVEIEVITEAIVINPDFGASAAAAMPVDGSAGLVTNIQRHLKTLGYYSGPIDGELTTNTVIAISEYEATKGLPVTGEATQELARTLAAEVDAQA